MASREAAYTVSNPKKNGVATESGAALFNKNNFDINVPLERFPAEDAPNGVGLFVVFGYNFLRFPVPPAGRRL